MYIHVGLQRACVVYCYIIVIMVLLYYFYSKIMMQFNNFKLQGERGDPGVKGDKGEAGLPGKNVSVSSFTLLFISRLQSI